MSAVKIPRLLKWSLVIAFIFLVLMTLLRLGFFFHFKLPSYNLNNCFNAFVLGLRYDLRTACCIALPVLLTGNFHITKNEKTGLTIASYLRLLLALALMITSILLLKNNKGGQTIIIAAIIFYVLILLWLFIVKNCNPFLNNTSKKIWKIYLLIITIGIVFLFAIDLQHYDYLHQRLNASVLNYTEDAKISFSMVWQTYPVLKLLLVMLIIIFILSWIINWSFKKIKRSGEPVGIFPGFITGVFCLIFGLAIFGRASQYPLRWSDAFSFGDDFKANLSLNPVQSFFSTLQFRHSGFDEKKVRQYYPLMASYLGVQQPDSINLNYERSYQYSHDTNLQGPNVVVVICESFSAYKSSMWGNPLNTTPYFNEMCKQGVFFDHCFTPAYGTARGVWAVITGTPDVESPNTASRNPSAVSQHTIINDINGYKKFYFLGGSTSWANIRGLLTNNINDLNLYEEGSYKSKAIDVWGISDKHLFLEANDVLKTQADPFFAVIQTSDNHRPYTIPSEDLNEFKKLNVAADNLKKYGFTSLEELNAFRYTDFCYQQFIEAAKREKYFSNTIFVFVGDHGIRGDAGNMFPKCWTEDGVTTQHVPLLFYAPGLLRPARINATCSQNDILPTVAGILKTEHTNTTMGRNLFDTIPSTYNLYTSKSYTLYNGTHFYNHAFLFDPDQQQIGMMTDDYCYVKNLLSGKENFSSAKNNDLLPSTPATANDKMSLQNLTDAWYQTAKYLLLNNKKKADK